MVDFVAVLRWAQLVVLAMTLPLAAIAAWGYREAPVGRAVAALPLVSVGFLLAASDELLLVASPESLTLWHVGSLVGAIGLAAFALAAFQVFSGHREVGQ